MSAQQETIRNEVLVQRILSNPLAMSGVNCLDPRVMALRAHLEQIGRIDNSISYDVSNDTDAGAKKKHHEEDDRLEGMSHLFLKAMMHNKDGAKPETNSSLSKVVDALFDFLEETPIKAEAQRAREAFREMGQMTSPTTSFAEEADHKRAPAPENASVAIAAPVKKAPQQEEGFFDKLRNMFAEYTHTPEEPTARRAPVMALNTVPTARIAAPEFRIGLTHDPIKITQ